MTQSHIIHCVKVLPNVYNWVVNLIGWWLYKETRYSVWGWHMAHSIGHGPLQSFKAVNFDIQIGERNGTQKGYEQATRYTQCFMLCLYSTQTTNPTNRHELINFRIREDSWSFANFLSISWRSKILLRYRYDRVMNIRGIRLESLKYCQELTTIYKNRLGILHER